MTPALVRASLGYLLRHPWQSWLSIIGIALGVAVVVAVDLANHSARTAFQLSLEQVAGRATHQIEGASGSIPESLYARLRVEQGLRPSTPVVEGRVRIGERTLTLLGLDPFAARALRERGTSVEIGSLPGLLTEPGALLLGEEDARALGLEAGARLTLEGGGGERTGFVAGVVRTDDPALLEGLAVADIATAQELLGRLGRIDRIDLVLTEAQAEDLSERLPPGLRLVTAERRTRSLAQMTRAFHTNLTAMSLLAVLVGAFIIYNTMTFAVLRRRTLLGNFRTLGVTRGQLFVLVLGEAAAFAVVGGVLGCLAGIAVGWGLVQLVTRTINDIYFALTVSQLHLSHWSLLKGAGIGLLATLIAALGPALEAAASQPRDVLRRHRVELQGRRLLPWLALAGSILMAAGWAWTQFSERSLAIGFVGLFMVVVGFSLCVPLGVRGFAWAVRPFLAWIGGYQGRLAARGIDASISRTGIAVAALTVAVSATVGVGIMIGSFRASVASWLEGTLSSDIYVSVPASDFGGGSSALPPGAAEAVLSVAGVKEISKGRSVRVESAHGPVSTLVLEPSSQSPGGFRYVGETPDRLWPRLNEGGLILVSEPYAYRHQLATGDTLPLFTSSGWRDFEVGGIFVDYGSDSGMLVLPRQVYARYWRDVGMSTIGVILSDEADHALALERLRERMAGLDPGLQVRDTRGIRDLSLEVFDRTFAITHVLRMLAVGVAFVGVLSALMALQLERSREYAILRATGVTRGQLVALVLLQTGAMGLAAGLLAVPLGWMLGDLLIHVVNLRSFGWSMDMILPAAALAGGPLLALASALLAGIYPAIRSARTDPAAALRDE